MFNYTTLVQTKLSEVNLNRKINSFIFYYVLIVQSQECLTKSGYIFVDLFKIH